MFKSNYTNIIPLASDFLHKPTMKSINAINAGMNVQQKIINSIPVPVFPA